ncbi:MAG: DNA mismatch repair protein MutS [Desulfobacterales bacterium]|jgi:DNA mismatch repair protein MutS|nr:DNA mismatch repair protein MutS [Desulfobacterales bacterium]
MAGPKTTPMMQQYLSIKADHGDAILFYRMGDFYEMFFDDALVASKVLEITLTSRNKNEQEKVPMCGVPYRAAQSYIARLIENGHKVAICDQVEDPATAKGLVKREVVRVITPGMIVEDAFLEEKINNYILSVAKNKDTLGIAYLDISTGAFRVTETVKAAAIADEIFRISPSEATLPEGLGTDGVFLPIYNALRGTAVTRLPDSAYEPHRAKQQLTEQFNTLSLEGFGCEKLPAAISAAGGLLHYVKETQKQKITHLSGIETYFLNEYLWVDDTSCQNLELLKNMRTGTKRGALLGVIDYTRTAMGGRMLRNWLRYPLLDKEKIEARLDAVEEALKNVPVRRCLREKLKHVQDMERLGSKITMGHCNARDLTALKHSIQQLPEIWTHLSGLSSFLYLWAGNLEPLEALAERIEAAVREDAPPTINEGGMIKTGFSPELDALIRVSRDGKGFLAALEADERGKTGINSLKVRYNKVFGYYIEVPNTHSQSVPDHYVRKQTLVNAERYITDELKQYENQVLGAEEKRASMEYDIFTEIRNEMISVNVLIQGVAKFIARVDCLLSLAELAQTKGYCRPRINTEGSLTIESGRHPVVEIMISGERFVPNTIRMDDTENQVLIITGPNMAGKSTVLRQVAIFAIMAQLGSFVPAARADLPVIDRIFTRVGALDNLSAGQSTFMVEMQETANILNHATPQSLVIIDEIGRGTSTFDGMSIAWAVAEYLHDLHGKGVKTLFATHYHELTELVRQKNRVKNFHIAVKEWNDEIIFLRKLVEGGTNRSYGIQVARLAGIPDEVIRRSKKILLRIETANNGVKGLSADGTLASKEPKGPVQMDMFCSAEKMVMDKLRHLDIAGMTPLEALNTLDELCRKAKF